MPIQGSVCYLAALGHLAGVPRDSGCLKPRAWRASIERWASARRQMPIGDRSTPVEAGSRRAGGSDGIVGGMARYRCDQARVPGGTPPALKQPVWSCQRPVGRAPGRNDAGAWPVEGAARDADDKNTTRPRQTIVSVVRADWATGATARGHLDAGRAHSQPVVSRSLELAVGDDGRDVLEVQFPQVTGPARRPQVVEILNTFCATSPGAVVVNWARPQTHRTHADPGPCRR
jgi:hypothetical protein